MNRWPNLICGLCLLISALAIHLWPQSALKTPSEQVSFFTIMGGYLWVLSAADFLERWEKRQKVKLREEERRWMAKNAHKIDEFYP